MYERDVQRLSSCGHFSYFFYLSFRDGELSEISIRFWLAYGRPAAREGAVPSPLADRKTTMEFVRSVVHLDGCPGETGRADPGLVGDDEKGNRYGNNCT